MVVYHGSGNGPNFGQSRSLNLNHVLEIGGKYLNNNNSFCILGYSYPDILGKGNSTFSGDANTSNFKLKEMEVFRLNY